MTVKDRLEYLRGEILAERISYGEIMELRDLAIAGHIEIKDQTLLEWAGVCPKYLADVLPDEDGNCSLCGLHSA